MGAQRERAVRPCIFHLSLSRADTTDLGIVRCAGPISSKKIAPDNLCIKNIQPAKSSADEFITKKL